MIDKNDNLLLNAAKSGDIKRVGELLATGANVDGCDRNGTTALMFAANLGYTEIVRSLLDFGANINLPRKTYGLTALMLAASNNQVDIVKLLISKDADINAVNEDGSTALMAAAQKGHLEIVQILLNAGADA
ncbi:MAG: ankyrin repeat domain-containing protein, partial [Sphaerospermopsis kisseleviana]